MKKDKQIGCGGLEVEVMEGHGLKTSLTQAEPEATSMLGLSCVYNPFLLDTESHDKGPVEQSQSNQYQPDARVD